jgi:ribose-phosphate pyrophosphokinase
MLLWFDDEAPYAARLAAAAGLTPARIERHRFPDGECKLRLPPALPAHVVLLRSLHQPNEKLVELLLAARTARTLGAMRLTLVAPYLCYMRQDAAFAPGEAVSQRIVGDWLAELFDTVITVDPHLHRVAQLSAAVPARRAVALTAAPLLGAALSGTDLLLVGPDEESAGWAEAAADAAGAPCVVCRKQRHGDRAVEVVLPPAPWRDRRVVVVDDVASTGHTLATVARQAIAAGAARVDVAVTHALMVGDAADVLARAGVASLISADTVPHPSNRVSTAALVAATLRGAP